MKKITALTPQKRNENRVNVYLDGEFAFGLFLETALGLRVGQILTAGEIADLHDREQFAQAKEQAFRLLGYRPRSVAEVRRRLRQKGHDEALVEQVLDYLIQKEYLDDREFADYWVEQRETFKPRGPMALRQELREKGLSRQVIEAAIEEVDEEAGAEKVAAKRLRRWSDLPYDEFRQKMGPYLLRRGFSYDVARRTTEKMWEEISGDESTSERR